MDFSVRKYEEEDKLKEVNGRLCYKAVRVECLLI